MAVTLNQIIAEIEVTKILSSHFMEVFNFADLQLKYKGNSPELKHLCKLKDILHKLDEHYETFFAKKNPEPNERGPIHAEWLYNQTKYMNERYTCFWNKYVEHDPIYNKYRKLYNKYFKQILNDYRKCNSIAKNVKKELNKNKLNKIK